ncbi:MAG: CHAT domain-containing tetratricopeptide repeat protein, partial [Acidobacteriota bacterium]
ALQENLFFGAMRSACRWLLLASVIVAAAPPAAAQRDPQLIQRIRFLEPVWQLARAGRPVQARQQALQLLAEVEVAHGEGSFEVAAVLDEIAGLAYPAGRPRDRQAAAAIERALAIKRALLGPEHPEVARSLNVQAILLGLSGRAAEAQPLYEEALRIRRRAHGPRARSVAESLMNLAVLHAKQGHYDEAWPLAHEAQAIRQEQLGPSHPLIAVTSLNLGRLALLQGDYRLARELFDRSRRLALQAQGPENPLLVNAYQSLSQLARLQGDFQRAEETAREALRIALAVHGTEHPLVASVQANLAQLDLRAGRLAEARRLAAESHATTEMIFGTEHPDMAEVLSIQASIDIASGGIEAARASLERALAIRQSRLPASHPATAETLHDLADLDSRLSEPERAVTQARQALALRREVLGPNHPAVAESLVQLARQAWLGGAPERALALGLEAEALGRRHLQGALRALSEREGLAYAADRISSLDLLLSLLIEEGTTLPPSALISVWEAVASGRALVLDEMVSRHRGLTDPALADRWVALATLRERLARQVHRGPAAADPSPYRQQLAATVARKEAAERALARDNADFKRQQETLEVGWSELVAALPDDAALVSWVRFERWAKDPAVGSDHATAFYLALIGRAGAAPRVVPLESAETIDRAVERWLGEIAQPPAALRTAAVRAEERYQQAAAELSRLVWHPLEPHLAEADQILVVPDGSLLRVRFATLLDRAGAYLVESGPRIRRLSAERELLRRGPRLVGQGLLALAAPDFDRANDAPALRGASSVVDVDSEQPCKPFQQLRFGDLPGARQEAARIVELWTEGVSASPEEGVHQLLGPEAREERFKALAPGRRVLHLATHGFFLAQGCAGSSLDEPSVSHPLLYAGLALAGFNHRRLASVAEDDGVLTAEEIASLDLRGVERVVLSACGTGVGPVHFNEGILGLQRAFRIAGVGALVMSLWPVEDSATRDWMARLYEAWDAGLDTTDAVRKASLGQLRQRRRQGRSGHPFYWGAFIAVGAEADKPSIRASNENRTVGAESVLTSKP